MTTLAASPPCRPARGAFVLTASLLAAVGALPGCGRGGSHEITHVVERADAGDPAPEATLEQRFRPRGDASGDPHARLSMPGRSVSGEGAPRAPAWRWTTPEGWRELGPAPMREMAWEIGGVRDLQCSFSVLLGAEGLPGAGGGLASNVDRWRKQMSLPPEGGAGLAALPRLPMLGGQAVRIELTGTFTGMGGNAVEGAKLLGLVVELPGRTAFLKLTGVSAAVDAATPRFLELAASLAPAPSTGAHDLPVVAGPSGAVDTTPSPFTWTAPPEWKRQGAKSMRLATYVPAGATKTEIAVSIFPGLVGGARANVDRWRGQVGLGPVADAEFEALPRATLLGGPAVFVAVDGRYAGMAGAAGAEPTEGARLVAVAIERPKDVVFVKMTGPADEVRGEEARFRAFCESLRD